MAGVVLDHVTKVFPGGTVAVDDLSLEVTDGEFLILVGPSGCGKTTALRMIAGLERISAGEVRVGDTVLNDVPPKDRDRSEERRVGKECYALCRSRWSPYH